MSAYGDEGLGSVNPFGSPQNIGTPDWLTQVQHKGAQVDIVDHADHDGMPAHVIHTIGPDGSIGWEAG